MEGRQGLVDVWAQAGITVLGVATAVSATEWAVRARDRRRRIEEAILELVLLVPYVTVPISAVWQGERPDTSVGSEWAGQRDRVSGLLAQIRVNATSLLRRARMIRAEVDDLTARMAAADLGWLQKRKVIPADEIFELVGDLLTAQVFPRTLPLDETIHWYEQHGFASGRPPTTAPEGGPLRRLRGRWRRHR
jgi:hypothetical protein